MAKPQRTLTALSGGIADTFIFLFRTKCVHRNVGTNRAVRDLVGFVIKSYFVFMCSVFSEIYFHISEINNIYTRIKLEN